MDVETLVRLLGLEPLPVEGGLFVETWRSNEVVAAGALPARYGGNRALGTAIYYLLTDKTVSRMHRLRSDEVFHFYLGDPVEMLLLHPGGISERVTLGQDLAAGQRPQFVVLRGTWQGARLVPEADSRMAEGGSRMAEGSSRMAEGSSRTAEGGSKNIRADRRSFGGRFALLGTTVSPGFEYADFETGEMDELVARWPDRRDLIRSLC